MSYKLLRIPKPGKQQQQTFGERQQLCGRCSVCRCSVCRCMCAGACDLRSNFASAQQLHSSFASSLRQPCDFAPTYGSIEVNGVSPRLCDIIRLYILSGSHPWRWEESVTTTMSMKMRTTTTIYLADSFCRAEQRLIYLEPRFLHDECSNIFLFLFYDENRNIATPSFSHFWMTNDEQSLSTMTNASAVVALSRRRRRLERFLFHDKNQSRTAMLQRQFFSPIKLYIYKYSGVNTLFAWPPSTHLLTRRRHAPIETSTRR